MSSIRERMLPLVEKAEAATVTDHELMPILHSLTRKEWPGDDAMRQQLRDSGERFGLYRQTMDELVKRGFIKTARATRHPGSVTITPAGKKWHDKALSWWS